MTRWRMLCAALVFAGIALGTVQRSASPGDPGTPPTAGGYLVLAGDFHVHGWPDGIPPWDELREAKRRRLDVIALTSHNSLRGWWLLTHAPWRPATDVLALPGEELTSVGYHMAVVGVTRTVAWNQSASAAAAAVHALGGVAILAHPAGTAFERMVTDADLAAVDGIEVAHPADDTRRRFADVYRRALAMKETMAAIGSSDFHVFAPIGACRTYVFVRERTEAAVLDAIRAGRTVACDGRGGVAGPAELSTLVRDRCRADASLPPVGDTAWTRAGAVLSWTALLALVLAGAEDLK